METRQLGRSDLSLSVLGLGSWAIGGDIGDWGWGTQSEQDSINTIHKALESGINWIDTAPAYGLGNAERVIGKALKQTSQRPYIMTKCGFYWNQGESELIPGLSPEQITKEVEASLSRLGVDVIDLYQIHRPVPEHQLEQAWHTLAELKKQGKVREIGVSNFTAEQLASLHKIAPITSNQPAYSLLSREVEACILPWCQAHQVGTIHHSSMANGLLSGRMTKQRVANLDTRDWRHKSHFYQEPNLTNNLDFVAKLARLSEQLNCSVAQLSIAWTLAHPATTGTIIGARNVAQLAGLIGAAEIAISAEIYQRLGDLSGQLQQIEGSAA
ncbi:aldo/keto reductase [Motilimonas eburnea]|uniref:aldo/keto reductase n=1 Tax=Motilimonas eburnea TaxID=1737488 RepID=UPI001E39AC38|nr:aldo/keto reductase [Motilimonas eburnea]MCE2570049.1 aldo/keto reductase [Motilimonas eburnea]